MQKKSNETQSPESAVRHGVTFLRQAPKNGEGSSAKRIISHMSYGAGKSWGLLLKQIGSLQGIDISHLRKFGKSSTQICHFWGDMLVSWRVDGKMERCPLRNWDFLAENRWPFLKVFQQLQNNIFLGLPTSLVSNLNCNVSPPLQIRLRKNFDTIKEKYHHLNIPTKKHQYGCFLKWWYPPQKKKMLIF